MNESVVEKEQTAKTLKPKDCSGALFSLLSENKEGARGKGRGGKKRDIWHLRAKSRKT